MNEQPMPHGVGCSGCPGLLYKVYVQEIPDTLADTFMDKTADILCLKQS